MNNFRKIHCLHPKIISNRGVTLIEMMVAVLVLSIGLLGIAGLQAATAKYKINTWARASSATLMSDLSERVRVNPEAAGTSFAGNGVVTTSEYLISRKWADQQTDSLAISKNCETVACTSSERATFDLLTWRARVRESMPQGAAILSGDRRDGMNVTMMWFDKQQLQKDADDELVLASAPTCTSAGSEKGMAQQSCCPAAAEAPAGVRCISFSFVP